MTADFQQGLIEAARLLREKAADYDAKRIRAVEEGHPRSEARYETLRDAWLDQAVCIESQAHAAHAAE